jgi:hypothetical protein
VNAATEPRDIIAQAAREGLEIRRGDAPGKLKLRGTADAVARWKPIIAQHKPEVLAALSAANDTDLAGLLAAHGDGAAQGVDWFAWRLTTATSSPTWAVATGRGLTLLCTVEPIPKPRSYPSAWPVERIAPWSDTEDDAEEFEERAGIIAEGCNVSRAEAEQMAVEVIQRARACWDCRNLHAATRATDKRPRCEAGHRLVFRTSSTRTWPGRLDARRCGDRAA